MSNKMITKYFVTKYDRRIQMYSKH